MLIRSTRYQHGLSIVELMVGIAVGLFIVAAATLVVTAQLGENRRLLLETQLQQDLRASIDIVSRELRRAGSWGSSQGGVWYPGRPGNVSSNSFAGLTLEDEGGTIKFEYQRRPDEEGPYGFLLNSAGVIRTLLGAGEDAQGNWQDLTDVAVMNVTEFDITVQETSSDPIPCPKACPGPGGETDCWPRLIERTVRIDITAEARVDASISRTMTTLVRLRNDEVQFNNGAAVCP